MDIPLPTVEHHASRFHVFMQIAMALAIITGIEIVIIFVPVADAVQYTTLIVLSAVKFLAVIFYFMHLRWDKPFCTILFFIGLILGGGTMAALLALFGTDHTLTSAEAEKAAALDAPVPALVADNR
jgi:cytochrome c oxidase subunit 4